MEHSKLNQIGWFVKCIQVGAAVTVYGMATRDCTQNRDNPGSTIIILMKI